MAQADTRRISIIKRKLTQLTNLVIKEASKADADIVRLELELPELELVFQQFSAVHDLLGEAIHEDSESELEAWDTERSEYRSKYIAAKHAVHSVKANRQENQEITVKSLVEQNQAFQSDSDARLARIEIPKFSGEYNEWLHFHDLFLATIHNNKRLSNVQKLHYLKTSLTGDALRIIYRIPISDMGYEDAWQKLNSRYTNKGYLIKKYLDELLHQAEIKQGDASALRGLMDTTDECVQTLKSLGAPVEYWDIILEHIVTERLDVDTRTQWGLTLKKNEMPTYTELLDFLDIRCRAFESNKSISTTKQTTPSNQNSRSGHQSIVKVHHVATEKPPVCYNCKQDHRLMQCPNFNALSAEERNEWVKNAALCFNCLRSGHIMRDCKNQWNCRICNKRHHTLLHSNTKDSEQPNEAPTATVQAYTIEQAQQSKQVLLATAMIRVKDANARWQECRALLDGGSQASFITEACAQRLQLAQRHCDTIIRGVGQSPTEAPRNTVTITFRSIHDEDQSYILESLVMSTITSILPSAPLDSRFRKQFSNLQLADPNFHISKGIDILIGGALFFKLLKDGEINYATSDLCARNTHLGWVIAGECSKFNSTSKHKDTTLQNFHTCIDISQQFKKFREVEKIGNSQTITSAVVTSTSKGTIRTTLKKNAKNNYGTSLPAAAGSPSHTNVSHLELSLSGPAQVSRVTHKARVNNAYKSHTSPSNHTTTLEHSFGILRNSAVTSNSLRGVLRSAAQSSKNDISSRYQPGLALPIIKHHYSSKKNSKARHIFTTPVT